MMPGSGPVDARVMIVGEAPGEREEQVGQPFVGPSGEELNRMLHDAGLLRSECFVTNVARQRPRNNKIDEWFVRTKNPPKGETGWTPCLGGWAKAPVVEGFALLRKEFDLIKPKLVIPLGNLALLALTGEWGITKWRGSEMVLADGTICLPVIHPAAVLRDWSQRFLAVQDLKRAKRALERGVVVPDYAFVIRPDYPTALATLQSLLSRLASGPTHISCDIETRAGHIACIGFAWSRTEAICIPLMCTERLEGYWTAEEETELVWLMREVLHHPNARVSGQNFSYDTQYLWRHWRCIPRLGFDTMIGHHVCFPGTDKDLATLSSLYCDYHLYWKDDGKEWEGDKDEDRWWRYNATDCCRTWEIAETIIDNAVEPLGFVEQCLFQHYMWWRTLETMIRGVRVDPQQKQALSSELGKELAERESWLQDICGHELNVRSAKQMQAFFYTDLQLPVQRDRKTKKPTLADEALDKLAAKEPLIRPVIRKIREMRSIGVFRSTFVEARLDRDQRIRTSYNVAGTETFRFSSSANAFGSGLNLQNIPKGGEADDEIEALTLPNVRHLFLPDQGYEIFDMDLDSADLRIVVAESNCKEMKAMLAAGKKPYVEIAKEYYHDPSITKAHPKYGAFKSLCHGTNYLGTAFGIAPRIGLLVREVERIQRWYFGRFPEIAEWQKRLKEQMKQTHSVRNAWGYRRFYFDRVDDAMFRAGVAWIPQSSVGLLINKIWSAIREAEPEVQVLMQVHDSLVAQYPIAKAEYFRKRLPELSAIPIPYDDPLLIPTGFKYSQVSWGACGD